jgi:hypothetical protein
VSRIILDIFTVLFQFLFFFNSFFPKIIFYFLPSYSRKSVLLSILYISNFSSHFILSNFILFYLILSIFPGNLYRWDGPSSVTAFSYSHRAPVRLLRTFGVRTYTYIAHLYLHKHTVVCVRRIKLQKIGVVFHQNKK